MKIGENKSAKLSDDALVQRLYIAAPCDVPWDSMEGDERTRFCGQCKLNVYNVAELSSKETASLIQNSEGRVCMRLYRRKDGTIITDNCPVGLRKVRDHMKRCAVAVLMSLTWLGLISSARAQGLLDAQVDPRYGMSGEVGSLTYYEPSQSSILMAFSSWLSCVLLGIMIFLKRGRVALLGTMLMGVWALTGAAYGILYESGSHCVNLTLSDQDFLSFLLIGGNLILLIFAIVICQRSFRK